jgi:aldehyde dehydrogenase (NAD+)
MTHERRFYIGGKWVEPIASDFLDVIDPSTEQPITQIAMGAAADVDVAVAAARAAFTSYSRTAVAERVSILQRILESYERRYDEIAHAISMEMGAPKWLALEAQAQTGVAQLQSMIEVLGRFQFESPGDHTLVMKEPIGVCGLITPWNWPIHQIACKVIPALAAGCTVVLKPSELAPLSAILFAEVLHEAKVPEGVFNLIHGDGATVGQAIARHPDVDMVSFTGSTRAGVLVAKAAADTVKRVSQELGGKSANILLPDVDFERVVALGVTRCFRNSGQSCTSPSRMLVPVNMRDHVVELAQMVADSHRVGPPDDERTMLGPVANRNQFDKVQRLIGVGIAEGATLVSGGLGRPDDLKRGFYVRPTVFADVGAEMTIAKEEIFGPVLSILTYESEEDAIRIANDTPYGLAAYVQSADINRARKISAQMRAGQVYINHPSFDPNAPFGGYKRSGNGRECGAFGLEEFLEIKAIVGYADT